MQPLPIHALPQQTAVRAVPTTMAGLIDRVDTDADLPAGRRRDLASAIRRLCVWSRRDPALVPASRRIVAQIVSELHWKEIGVARKTFQNACSGVDFALDRYSRLEKAARGRGLGKVWAALWTRLPEGDRRWRLSRLAGFCDARGITPEAVDDGVLAMFREWLIEATLVTRPEALVRATILAWNRACGEVGDWPGQPLSVPSNRRTYALPWDRLPEGLRLDAEAWLARSADPDPFDDDAPLRPWSPSTVASRRFSIRQLVSALHCRGRDVSGLGSLADLVEVDAAKDALRFFLDAKDNRTSSQIAGLASLLVSIARYWVRVDDAHLAKLQALAARLAVRRTGLTEKNRNRLRQFVDRKALIGFLALPQVVLERLQRNKLITADDARDMQIAVAVEILLMAPFRRRNLVSIEIDRHLQWVGRGRERRLIISFPGEEVKNRVALDFPVPKETADLVDFYVEHCLPLLRRHADAWLFPGDLPGTHKHPDQFSRQFTKTIRRLTGLTVNMHLMRHLGALLYLDRNPGAYEVVRRVLGHKRLSTTVNSYTGAETDAAIRHFDAIILGIRAEAQRGDDDDA